MTLALPKALEPYRHSKCWVNWRFKAKGNGKFTKPPYQPSDPSKYADASDPATWGTFDEALANVERGLADGVGICLLGATGLAGIDLDDCIDATGVEPRALKLIETAASYTELSPSGNGFHIFILSDGSELNRKQAVLNANGMSIEVARRAAKYFTVTGDQWPGTPNVLRQTDGLADTVVKLLDEEAAQQPNSSKKRDLDDIIKNGRYELFKKGKDGKEDRSRAVWWVINELIRRGKTDDEIVAVLLDRSNRISDHIYDQKRGAEQYARKQVANARAAPPQPSSPQGLPELIVDAGNLPGTAELIAKMFAEQRRFLSNGREPVQVVCDNDEMPVAVTVTPEAVRCFAHKVCIPKKYDKRSDKIIKATLSVDVANLYLRGLVGEWGLKPFNGITTSPILVNDGSFRVASGYDEVTGIWCHNIPAVDVPEEPSGAQAKASFGALRRFFRTFAFADAARTRDPNFPGVDVVDLNKPIGRDESSFLVSLMTAVCRASLNLAPGALATAPAVSGAGTGKGLAMRSICVIGSGASPSAFTAGHDDEELDKRLTSALVQARPAIFLDNYNSKSLTSDILASALTENPCEVRPMGQTVMVRLHTRTFVAMTGNAVQIAEDMVSRVVVTNFDAKVENPELRPFPPGFLNKVHEARATLLGHALTIWRWGRQNPGALTRGKPLRSYDVWAEWCRDPLLSLGASDPVDRLSDLKAADPKRKRILAVFDAWWKAHKDALLAAKDLNQSVLEEIDGKASTNRDGVFKYNKNYVTWWLQNHTNTRVSGYVLTSEDFGTGKRPSINYRLTFECPKGGRGEGV